MLRRGIDGLYGSSSFNFLRNLHAVSIVAVPVCIPTAQSYPFLYFSSTSYLLSDKSHSERCEVTALRMALIRQQIGSAGEVEKRKALCSRDANGDRKSVV